MMSSRFTWSSLVFAGLTVGGFVAILLGWRIAAGTLVVAFQVPALVSGGLGGLALVVLGTGYLHVQLDRQWAADEQAELDRVLHEAEVLSALLEDNR